MSRLAGQMMHMPLLISSLITHAARHSGDTEIVSKRVEGDLYRCTWSAAELRARKVAQALARLGCQMGDRVGTLAWNGYRHLEIYYGASGNGFVCHTVNPRLFPQQIAWIINDAADRILCFDLNLLALVEKIAADCKTVEHFVLLGSRAQMPAQTAIPGLLCYEALVEAETGDLAWPVLDENAASSICYTSGTTGDPKGVVYSHRSTVLHSYAAALPDAMNLSSRDVVLPVVPMFHVNAWGLPYSTAMVGCKVVFPGPYLDGKSLYELFEAEQVTFSAGVPTVWMGLLAHMQAHRLTFSSFRCTVIGGAACPPSMIDTLEDDFGIEVVHAWGMTELSPLGTLSRLRAKHADLPKEEQRRLLAKQGKAPFGIDLQIIDGAGAALPWDGRTSGELMVKGHWVVSDYFGSQKAPLRDGWFPTGDVATIDEDGFMQVTDRSKDMIKSGGEWISSITLENIAVGHPAVQQAAAISVPHPQWGERPLLAIVLKPGAAVGRADLLAFFEGKVPAWQVPDDVIFLPELPQTATGKIQKLRLREAFKDHRWR
jgi:3-(methylthio)propionyl---CoA ligase